MNSGGAASTLSMVETRLPPGFRFHPRDDELIGDYLMIKAAGGGSSSSSFRGQFPFLIDVDLNKCEPWDIPSTACVGGKEWYFYSQRDRKYATGLRTNRATTSGYWKATGKDRPVNRKGVLVGMRKTLVFYQGRAPKGQKTDWVMHEFRIEGPLGPPKVSTAKEDWVLCRVFYKNREGIVKQGTLGSSSDETSSSSLPPLMDSYITFDQTQINENHHAHEQVPCFSILMNPNNNNHTQQITNPNFSQLTHIYPNLATNFTALENNNNGVLTPDFETYLNSTSYDKEVIKAVLNHLTKIESNPNLKTSSSFGEASTSNSFLSEVGLPTTMWNPF